MRDAERFRMAKITLERWHVDDDGAVRTRDGRDVVVAFDHRVIVADADARLIAAAPDLLDACVRLLDAVARGDHKAKAIDAARAAVAKATGGKP